MRQDVYFMVVFEFWESEHSALSYSRQRVAKRVVEKIREHVENTKKSSQMHLKSLVMHFILVN